MAPLEQIIAANFTETNLRLDNLLDVMIRIEQSLKRTNDNFNRNDTECECNNTRS